VNTENCVVTEKLAQFVSGLSVADVPPNALDAAQNAVIDTVGCALAGSVEPAVRIARAWVDAMGAKKVSTIWGGGLRSTASEAAFVNGVASHALDFDDSLPSLHGHPSSVIVPVVMAIGEERNLPGIDVLAAYVVAVEVAGRLGLAIGGKHYTQGWHASSTVGAFSATAAAARLYRLTAKQLQNAWGIAASQSAGLIKNFGTMTKPMHAGNAARIGVVSAWMALQGFTANQNILDKGGFLDTYGGGDGVNLSDVLGGLGKSWEVLKPGIYVKRWPCCYCNHRPLGGIFELMAKHVIRPNDVENVDVGFVLGSDDALGGPTPKTGLEGKFSIEYVVAAALLDGEVKLESFTDQMVNRPEAIALTRKVRRYRVDDPKRYSSKVGYTDLSVRTRNDTFSMRAVRVPGSPDWPMSAEEQRTKFLDCASRTLEAGSPEILYERLAALRSSKELLPVTEILGHSN
jgi:2-methylcitrate dehydratase PrpD